MSPVSDKPTVEQLEELSAKATKGHWQNRTIVLVDADIEFAGALVDWWRSGGAELVRDGLRYRQLKLDTSFDIMRGGKYYDSPDSIDAVLDAARKSESEHG
jgi:hypothetical protein